MFGSCSCASSLANSARNWCSFSSIVVPYASVYIKTVRSAVVSDGFGATELFCRWCRGNGSVAVGGFFGLGSSAGGLLFGSGDALVFGGLGGFGAGFEFVHAA